MASQVFNALVDQCAIEKNCLFSSKDEAERVCLVGESGRFQVQNKTSIRAIHRRVTVK